MFGKKIKIVTHNGNFHPDDVFAVATLKLTLKKPCEIIRTRDPKFFEIADYVIDVGGEYDSLKNRFDHHQRGGAGKRENGAHYAAFGLVWKHLGEKLCGSAEVAEDIDKKLVQPTDMLDNGVEIVKALYDDILPYSIYEIIFAFYPTWKEENVSYNERFLEAVSLAEGILKRAITKSTHKCEGKKFVIEAYEKATDKRIIFLEKKYSWRDTIANFSETIYVILPDVENNTWHVGAVSKDSLFDYRKPFPEAWAGKKDFELASVTGVSDAIFCHNGRFLAVAKSKEGALKLAQLALEA